MLDSLFFYRAYFLWFMYLVAVIDWWSRYVLSWQLGNTMEADFCIEALDTQG